MGLAVYAADKVSKVRELRLLIVTGTPRGEVDAKFARYRASLEMLGQELADAHLVALLRFEVEALEQLPPLPDPSRSSASVPDSLAAREQRRAALALANVARGQRAALKRDISNGAVTVPDVLAAPPAPADRCTVAELLRSQPGWGPSRTVRYLTRHGVSEHKQLGQLTARQRAVLAANLA